MTHASPPASPVPPDDDKADIPEREAGGRIAVVRGLALAGIGLALAATLTVVVWAELPGMDNAGPALPVERSQPEVTALPDLLPLPLPEAAPPAPTAPDDEAEALRAEVQRLLRVADDLDAQFDRLAEERRQRDLQERAEDPPLPEAVALAATSAPGLPPPLPSPAPGEAIRLQPPPAAAMVAPPLDLAADVPADAAMPVLAPRSLVALAAPPCPRRGPPSPPPGPMPARPRRRPAAAWRPGLWRFRRHSAAVSL